MRNYRAIQASDVDRREPQKNLMARRRVTSRLCLKHPGSHAAGHILHFNLKLMGHKWNVNFKGVGSPCPENQIYFCLLDRDMSVMGFAR